MDEMQTTPSEARVEERIARRNWALDLADCIRADHLWLYALIANPRMMVQRQAHWKKV